MTKFRTKKLVNDIEQITSRYTLENKQDYYDLFLNNYQLSIKLNRLVEILKLNEEKSIYEQMDTLKNREINSKDIILLLDKYLSFKLEVGVEKLDYHEMTYCVDGIKKTIEDICSYPLLESDEQEIIRLAKLGNQEAKQKVINSNYRLVMAIAQKYKASTLSILDLFQEGVLGLIKALEKYDSQYNVKFSTYASIWINRYIKKLIYDNQKIFTIPTNKSDIIYRMKKYINKYQYVYLKEPSNLEIAEFLKVDVKMIETLKPYLNETIYDIDFDSCCESDEFESQILDKDLKTKVSEVLNKLDERSALIIKMYYGIDYDRPYTLTEISQKLNITKQRVEQIKKRNLEKIKTNKKIIDYK